MDALLRVARQLHQAPARDVPDGFLFGVALAAAGCAATNAFRCAFRAELAAGWGLLLGAWPWAAAGALALYAHRVASSEALQKEWRDFMGQWGGAAEAATCPICAEHQRATAWHFATMACCGGSLCWRCVRRHVEAVIDDGRAEMLCPLLPCRCVLPDTFALAAFRREQWSWGSFDVMGSLARRKRRSYNRWVLSSGLAASCSARVEDVVHCPGQECGHLWVIPRQLRRRKSREEPQSWWNPRSWSLGRHVGLYAPLTEQGQDLRSVRCPKCAMDFCLLCSRPWARGPKRGHAGKSCLEYSSFFTDRSRDDGGWAGAKACPGCGVRILRSWGCNHMTCTQCGGQWCWECRAKWTPRHYSCAASHLQQEVCAVL